MKIEYVNESGEVEGTFTDAEILAENAHDEDVVAAVSALRCGCFEFTLGGGACSETTLRRVFE